MDDKDFKQQLSQVAEWEIPDAITDVRPNGRGRRSNERKYQLEHEEQFLELFDGKNPTFPPKIIKFKHQAVVCGDCNTVCPDGRTLDYKLIRGPKATAWRTRCLNCDRYKNPYTGRFDLDVHQSQSAMLSWTRGVEESVYATLKTEDSSDD